MTPRHFKCSLFHKGTFDFNFECINLLQKDFCKQRYITLNATISGQDRIYPKTHLCRTFFAEYNIRVSAHDLVIEKGRYIWILRKNRICLACGLGLVENEEHFKLGCVAYKSLRKDFIYYYIEDPI